MDPDLRAARCIFYLLNHALNRDLMSPVWYGTVEYQRRFDVGPAYFSLDLPALEGKAVTWQDFGGLDRYLALLEYCSVRGDNRELIRCTSNQIRGAFAFSALQTHRALEAVCSGSNARRGGPGFE